MIEDNPIQRRFSMLQMFGQYYLENLTGRGYPKEADQITALLTPYEKQTLYRLARTLQPQSIMAEIGTFKGGSTYFLCAGASAKKATMHCIDTFMAENITGGEGEDTFTEFQRNLKPYTGMIEVHRGFSHDVVVEIPSQIDLLFIDGDHSWEGVTTDLKLYLPLLRENGVLIMHDSAHPPVRKAIQEMVLPVETKRLAKLPNMYAGQIG